MRFCITSETQSKKEDDIKQTTADAIPLISTRYVKSTPEYSDARTLIYVWGKKSFISEDSIIEDSDVDFIDVLDTGKPPCLQPNSIVCNTAGIDNECTSHISQPTNNSNRSSNPKDPNVKYKSPENFCQQQQDNNRLYPSGFDDNDNNSFDKRHSLTFPIMITSLANVKIIKVACGLSHLLLLNNMGNVYSFGVGSYGQLGLGENRLFVTKPQQLITIAYTVIIQIAAGHQHSVMLTQEGEVYTCGIADAVGDCCGIERHIPSIVPKTGSFIEFVSQIAAGYNQTMAVTKSNKLFVWGDTFSSHFYISPHCFQRFPRSSIIIQLSVGRQFALALSESGQVFAWGDGTYGELGRIKGPLSARAAGLVTRTLQPTELVLTDGAGSLLPKITSIAAGGRHALLLGEDGKVFSFGDNLCGQCGVPTHTTRLDIPKVVKINAGDLRLTCQSIAAGVNHSGAITSNNLLALWGHSSDHKLIYTAPTANLLEERFGIGSTHMGVSVTSGLKDCCPKPKIVHSLLNKKVTGLCLGDAFTVVVTGEGGLTS